MFCVVFGSFDSYHEQKTRAKLSCQVLSQHSDVQKGKAMAKRSWGNTDMKKWAAVARGRPATGSANSRASQAEPKEAKEGDGAAKEAEEAQEQEYVDAVMEMTKIFVISLGGNSDKFRSEQDMPLDMLVNVVASIYPVASRTSIASLRAVRAVRHELAHIAKPVLSKADSRRSVCVLSVLPKCSLLCMLWSVYPLQDVVLGGMQLHWHTATWSTLGRLCR